ncbi:MAG: hypothetical protein ABMA26_08270 [Limisphaerales bacterium]
MFIKRLGPAPAAREVACYGTFGCPDIWELADGDFAVIGANITTIATPLLPPSAGCAPDEAIIRIPRKLLVLAKRDIPETV